jgi:hypothetical protein
MAKKSSVISVMRRASGVMFGNPLTVLMMALPLGILSGWLNQSVLSSFGSGVPSEEDMLPLMGTSVGILLCMEIFLGPLLSAMTIYTARTHSHGGTGSIYKAFNFALNRYPKMLKWHAIAWICIHFGLALICVPGLFFVAIYAFVDPVLCLEKESWPLARSKNLSRGRRHTIFMCFLPWLIVSQIVPFIELFGFIPKMVIATGVDPSSLRLMEVGTSIGFVGINTVVYLVLIWTYMCFYMSYEDRTTPASQPATS